MVQLLSTEQMAEFANSGCLFFDGLIDNVEILNDIPGTGNEVVNHSKITVHYSGKLDNGKEFDSSYKRKQPFVFQIGTRQVIEGWELGIIGMKEGGKRSIIEIIEYQM